MSVGLRMDLNANLYLRDPQDSELGRNIIQHSILLITKLGFEGFNFKKLAEEISSTEASIYRYFENKHVLLIYLVSWYWEWMDYLIEINTLNIEDPHKKLKIIIHSVISASHENEAVPFVNESKLNELVISEGAKAYYTKEVDAENAKGFFKNYKDLSSKVAQVILQIKPDFPYPHAIATNLLEMSSNHIYYAQHLPRLTDVHSDDKMFLEVEEMVNYIADAILK